MSLRAKKRYGQHFLQGTWADRLVAVMKPGADEQFIEIGPGPGALTLRLAPRVRHLTAVELDADMVDLLRPRLPANVTVIQANFLDLDLASVVLVGPFRVAGNLPYNVSSPILFRLLEAHQRIGRLQDATLMVQDEVAERLTATPGTSEYGVLSIFVQLHCDVRRLLTLPPGAFRPAPKVHSAVVHFRFRPPAATFADARVFEAMVRSMFTQRRKTVLNALATYAHSQGAEARAALAAADIDPSRRPGTLQLTELARLADYFVSVGGRAVL